MARENLTAPNSKPAPRKDRFVKFVCWFSRKLFDIHDYKKPWGGDGYPAHFCKYNCWNCGKEFSI